MNGNAPENNREVRNKDRLAERSIEDIRSLVYEKAKPGEPFCCFIPEHRRESMVGCGRPAAVNIYCESDPPDVVTQACLLHVGELLSDGYCKVWPIEFDKEVEPEDVKTLHPLKLGMWAENGCGERRKIAQVCHDEKIYKVELETGHELWAWTACHQVPNQ